MVNLQYTAGINYSNAIGKSPFNYEIRRNFKKVNNFIVLENRGSVIDVQAAVRWKSNKILQGHSILP